MISHGYKTCVIETLKYNKADISRRMKQDHVIELAKSIKDTVALSPPVVNRKTKVLIAGRDRIAAYALNGTTRAWMHLVDADAKEMEDAERAENLYRRPIDRDALMEEEVKAREQTIKEAEEEEPIQNAKDEAEAGPKKKGRKKTAKGKAREEIAKKAGTSADAVRKAEERAKKKRGEPTKAISKATGIKKDMLEIRAAIGLVVKPLIAAQSAVGKLLKNFGPVMGNGSEATLQRLDQQLHECFSVVKFLRPEKACGYCKGERLVEGRDCSGCGGAGYLTEGAAEVPEAVAAE